MQDISTGFIAILLIGCVAYVATFMTAGYLLAQAIFG